jgi:hypothetical protein
MTQSRTMLATAILLALAGSLAACDDQAQRSASKMESGARISEGRAPASDPGREARTPVQQAEAPKLGAGPESPPGAVANVVGTWRLRLKSGADEAQPGITYTFTADGRVTVGPDQICRYKVENQVLSIDCAGTTAESATGRLEREDENHLIWRVAGKTVRLDRQNGVKEQ